MPQIHINESMILEILKNLKSGKAIFPDGIRPACYDKMSAEEIAAPSVI